jgi:hypothetical protein
MSEFMNLAAILGEQCSNCGWTRNRHRWDCSAATATVTCLCGVDLPVSAEPSMTCEACGARWIATSWTHWTSRRLVDQPARPEAVA